MSAQPRIVYSAVKSIGCCFCLAHVATATRVLGLPRFSFAAQAARFVGLAVGSKGLVVRRRFLPLGEFLREKY